MVKNGLLASSPRPWGCFASDPMESRGRPVFPTPVGVFHSSSQGRLLKNCLPHARGGVSSGSRPSPLRVRSSPRPWGCFLLTSQGKRLGISLPHARGGVSIVRPYATTGQRSSPRPWGCFYTYATLKLEVDVFPTPVGVFPHYNRLPIRFASLPHARGGVS